MIIALNSKDPRYSLALTAKKACRKKRLFVDSLPTALFPATRPLAHHSSALVRGIPGAGYRGNPISPD
jgi:hypothetical protein